MSPNFMRSGGLLKLVKQIYLGTISPPGKSGLNFYFEWTQKDLKTFEIGKTIFYELKKALACTHGNTLIKIAIFMSSSSSVWLNPTGIYLLEVNKRNTRIR